MTDATTATRVLEPEVLDPEKNTGTLAVREAELAKLAAGSWLERMGSDLEKGMELFEQRANMLAKGHAVAISRTRPEDWILFKGPSGEISAMLAGAGAEQVAEIYGVQITELGPLDKRGMFDPVRQDVPNLPGVYWLRCFVTGHSHFTGRYVEKLEVSRRSDEKFLGRMLDSKTGKFDFKGDAANEGDMRAALQTGARTKLVRVLCGMSKLPISELEKAKLDTSKCRQGSGFGSSDQRKAAASGDAESAAGAEAVWKEILRRTAGDETAAHEVLRDITKYAAYKKKDGTEMKGWPGADTFAQLNTTERIGKAKERLAKHEVFGDEALKRKDGED